MTCSDFLDLYADFRDGALTDPALRTAVEQHFGACLRCRRLAKTLTRGLAVLHEHTEELEPSAGFRTALTERLRAEAAIGSPVAATHAGVAASLLLVAALGLLVVEGALPRDGASPPAAPAAFQARLTDVTLPAFAHSTLEFHGTQAPLGSYVLFVR